jgi:pimeloyl-ACP methyl ester carboxylesterase
MYFPALKRRAKIMVPLRGGARRLAHALRTLLAALIFMAGLLFIGIEWIEEALTFHPERWRPGEVWTLPQGGEDVWLTTADGVRLHGWFVSSYVEPSAATVIFFHGNGGNISYLGWLGEALATRGFDVLLFDYRGYGRSEGPLMGEQGIYSDADAACDYVLKERGVRPEKLVLYGQSLGTTAVVDVASRRQVGAIILESGLSSAADMAASMFPWVPRRLHSVGKNRFESARKLSGVHCPVLVAHGDPDPTIPTEQGRKLYLAANEPKKLIIIPGAGHGVASFGGDRYLDAVAEFIRGAVRADS